MKPPKRRAFQPQQYVSDTNFEIQATETTVLRFVIIPDGMRVDVARTGFGVLKMVIEPREVAELADLLRVFDSVTSTKLTCSMSWRHTEVTQVVGRRLKKPPQQDSIAATYGGDAGVHISVLADGKRASGLVPPHVLRRLYLWLAEAARDMR